ncbi:MAG TPA: glycosyltransferase, partial [Blastocatellia bacterium]|nr:glycosyltransferase [Blastocatellia bacterium]
QLEKDNQARRELTIEQRNELAERARQVEELEARRRREVEELEAARARQAEELEAARARQVEELEAGRRREVENLVSQIHSLNAQLAEHGREVLRMAAELKQKDEDTKVLNAYVETLSGQNRLLVAQLRERDHHVKVAQSDVADLLAKFSELSAKFLESEHKVRALSTQLANRNAEAERLLAQLANRGATVEMLAAKTAHQDELLAATNTHLANVEAELSQIKHSLGWRLLSRYGRIKYRYLKPVINKLKGTPTEAQSAAPAIAQATSAVSEKTFPMMEVAPAARLQAHQATVDIIVCVHNALDDVKHCLDSLVRYTRLPYSLILVDDGSDEETRGYLSHFATYQGAALIRNEEARGYTYAANQGLRQSRADYAILLNSDTQVTPDWLDRMVACGESDPRIGLIGPLSNTASWQSVPEIFDGSDWAKNELPEDLTVADMGQTVAQSSARLYPRLPFLNGFCLMIKKKLIDEIGYFDEETFGEGYGEENDYSLRAAKAGWQLAVADDVYIYHSQSRSYSNERRKELVARSDKALVAKHGQKPLADGVTVCRYDRVLEGVRARSRFIHERQEIIEKGQSKWEGKRVLFILPLLEPAGGANVIIQEGTAMQKMGVDVRILTLTARRAAFERIYSGVTLPLVDVENEQYIPALFADYDAVVAAMSGTVDWLDPLTPVPQLPVRGYYIQDFEPRFFPEGTAAFRTAWNSYTRYTDLVRVTKTEWNRDTIKKEIRVDCSVVGPSVDTDLHRPRHRRDGDWPARPLRIAAMIRPSTPRRNPRLTMEVLREIYGMHKDNLQIILFGCDSNDPEFGELPQDFAWRNAGVLTRPQLAFLLNEVDMFVDFSTFQAMGLTALESMACGAAVILPESGGAASFARHEENSLMVNTASQQACLDAVQRLIMDAKLRAQIQHQAMYDVCQFFPERAAFNILSALFAAEG